MYTLSTFGLAVIHRIFSVGGEHVGETFMILAEVGGGIVMGQELLHLWVVDGIGQTGHLGELTRHDGDRRLGSSV